MKRAFPPTVILFIFLSRSLAVSAQKGIVGNSHQREDIDNVATSSKNKRALNDKKPAMEENRVLAAYKSGLKGATASMVISGVPGGQTTGKKPTSLEFAVAPIEGEKPAYAKAVFVRSDAQGKYEVNLPPGKYWIGPKAKALDPVNYRPRAVSFSEKVAVVKEGVFTQIDLVEVAYAP